MSMSGTFPWTEADGMRDLLAVMADELAGCTEGSPEEARLEQIADALDAYEAKRDVSVPSGSDVGNG